jgi:hypothetical protein
MQNWVNMRRIVVILIIVMFKRQKRYSLSLYLTTELLVQNKFISKIERSSLNLLITRGKKALRLKFFLAIKVIKKNIQEKHNTW